MFVLTLLLKRSTSFRDAGSIGL